VVLKVVGPVVVKALKPAAVSALVSGGGYLVEVAVTEEEFNWASFGGELVGGFTRPLAGVFRGSISYVSKWLAQGAKLEEFSGVELVESTIAGLIAHRYTSALDLWTGAVGDYVIDRVIRWVLRTPTPSPSTTGK
jgi:hypothetical protein